MGIHGEIHHERGNRCARPSFGRAKETAKGEPPSSQEGEGCRTGRAVLLSAPGRVQKGTEIRLGQGRGQGSRPRHRGQKKWYFARDENDVSNGRSRDGG